MPSKTPKNGLPKRFVELQRDNPEVFEASGRLGPASRDAGAFDQKTTELLRLAITVGTATEGRVHSHVRRALEAGATPAEVGQGLSLHRRRRLSGRHGRHEPGG